MLNNPKFYLEKFKEWRDNLKINNPLETVNIFRNVFYNDSREVLWMEFKEPLFSISIVQRNCQKDCFDFYVAKANSNIKFKNCNFENYINVIINDEDFLFLDFLSKLGMIEYRIISTRFKSIECKFKLKERIL